MSVRPKIHVLVIADGPSADACAAVIVPDPDHTITIAHTAAEGRRLIHANEFNVVVADDDLPDMSGMDVIGETAGHLTATAVVLLAAAVRQKACIEALDHGVTYYLIKDDDAAYLDALPLAIDRATQLQRVDIAKHLYLGTSAAPPPEDSQARFHDFADTASDFFWEMDADLRFSYLSERFTVVSGVPAGPILGRTREEIGCPPGVAPEAWDQLLRDSHAHKPITNFEMVRSKPDGQDIHLSISANPVFDDRGNFQGYRGTGTDVTDLAHAKRMISEKHDLLLDAIECIPDGLALFDEHERLIIANSHYRRMFPRALTYFDDPKATFEDFLRTNHQSHPDLAPEVDIDEFVRIRLEHFRQHKSMKRQMPSGEWILSRERPTTSGGTVSVRTDITELVTVTQRADDNQALLVNALEAAPDSFAVYDKDERLVVCNDKYRAQYPGIDAFFADPEAKFEDFLRSQISTQRVPMANEDPEDYIQNRLKVFRECGAFEREHNSGEWFLSREIRMPDGGTMSIRTDISDLKRATGALKESELHLKMALESFPEPLAIYDPEDRIIICNDRFTNQFDWSAPYFIPGASFEETLREAVLRGEYPAAFEREEAYIRERLDQRVSKSFDYESYKADGRAFRHLGRRLANGGHIAVRIDITELKSAQQNAEAASEAKSMFLAAMSHELRTPLNAVMGFGQMLSHSAIITADERLSERVDYILKGGRSMLAIVEQTLTYANVMGSNYQITCGEINGERLSALIENSCVSKEVLAHELDVSIANQCHGVSLPNVAGAELAISNVFDSIIDNAIKYNVEDGDVTMSYIGVADGLARFEVCDTGIGIPGDVADKIFEPFERLNQAAGETEGIGVGLSIARRLMNLMGGEIEYQRGPDGGSIFRISLPIAH